MQTEVLGLGNKTTSKFNSKTKIQQEAHLLLGSNSELTLFDKVSQSGHPFPMSQCRKNGGAEPKGTAAQNREQAPGSGGKRPLP